MTLGDSLRVSSVCLVGMIQRGCYRGCVGVSQCKAKLVAFMNLVGNKRNQSIIIKFGEVRKIGLIKKYETNH